jgi:hypothetical protein
MYEYSIQEFRSIYRPKQEMSLDKAMIPQRGPLKFRTYNPRIITKHGVLVRMVREVAMGYICNMEMSSAEGKKLEDTVLSILDRNRPKSTHLTRQLIKQCVISSNTA